MTTTRRRPARSLTLTMKGFAAAWRAEQQAALAARPVESTAACACCDTVYSVKGLKPLDSDAVYMKASEVVSFERDDLVCRFCREDFQADFGDEDADVYSIFDTGRDRND
jgi:hypothetical protein